MCGVKIPARCSAWLLPRTCKDHPIGSPRPLYIGIVDHNHQIQICHNFLLCIHIHVCSITILCKVIPFNVATLLQYRLEVVHERCILVAVQDKRLTFCKFYVYRKLELMCTAWPKLCTLLMEMHYGVIFPKII